MTSKIYPEGKGGLKAKYDASGNLSFFRASDGAEIYKLNLVSGLFVFNLTLLPTADPQVTGALYSVNILGPTGTIAVDNSGGYGTGDVGDNGVMHVDGVTTPIKVGDRFTFAGHATIYTVTLAGPLVVADQDIFISPGLTAAVADDEVLTFGAVKALFVSGG